MQVEKTNKAFAYRVPKGDYNYLQCILHNFGLRKVSPAKQLLIQQVGFVNLKHFFQHRSCAKHWFKNLKILVWKLSKNEENSCEGAYLEIWQFSFNFVFNPLWIQWHITFPSLSKVKLLACFFFVAKWCLFEWSQSWQEWMVTIDKRQQVRVCSKNQSL